MQRCCRCKKNKNINLFNFKNLELGIRAKACKECTRQEVRKHYYNNHSYYLKKAAKRNIKIRADNKLFIWNYLLKHPCVDCGERDPVLLEFDHLSDKVDCVSRLMRTNTQRSLQNEIEKCEIRCANCHRRKTAKQLGWYKSLPM